MLTITKAGLAASASARENGFRISLTTFKVSEYDLANTQNTDLLEATDLLGNEVYTGQVALVEIVGTSSAKVTLEIPKELPRSGSWMLREIGIFLDTGELFAIGPLNPAYEKTNAYGMKFFTACTLARLGEVLNVTANANNSLPVVADVSQLPQPLKAENSAIVVLDETQCQYTKDFTAGLAVKSGPGLMQWSFPGHHRVYYGPATSIIDQTSFIISSATGGFWFNDKEYLIAQIATGAGAGQTRRMRYTKSLDKFITTKQFEGIDSTSMIALWRDAANQLPERSIELADFMVLGHGLASWNRVPDATEDLHTFTAASMSDTLNAESQVGSMIFAPPTADQTLFIWCDGKLLPENQYAMGYNILTIYGKPMGTKIDVLILTRVTSDIGGILNAFEANHQGDGETTRFYLSVIPRSRDWVQVYVDGEYLHQSQYDFNANNVVLHVAPAVGANVRLVQLGVYEDTGGDSLVTRTFRQIIPGEMHLALSDVPPNASQVQLFVDGKEYRQTDYQLLPSGIQLLNPPSFPGGLSYVDLFLFLPTLSTTNQYPTASVSGLDTGPQWIDPAGREGPPNKLVPITTSIISDGATTNYRVETTTNRNYVLVFANNQFIPQSGYSYSVDQYGTLIILDNPVPSGQLLDIVAFTEVTTEEGFNVECSTFSVLSSTDTVYQLASVSDVENIIVTVGGYYQHKRTYTVDSESRIFFQGVQPGLNIDVWYFNAVPMTGMRTSMQYDISYSAVANNYPLTQFPSRKQNVLVFAGATKYDNSQYELTVAKDKVVLSPNPASTDLTFISFVSGTPKTRLITREEYNRSVVSFNFRGGAIFLTREDVKAVLTREDVLALLTPAELAVLQGGGGGTVPHAEPGDVFATSNWTVPDGVYRIRAVIIGGGGQGGGGSADLVYAGHGGRKGEVIIQEFDVTPGQQLQIRLGVGGSSYLYTQDGTIVYPQPGDFGTSDGSRGYPGRDGGNTIFHSWVALGGLGGASETAYAPDYIHPDSRGEDQVPMSGTGTPTGGGPAGVTGVMTTGNDVMKFSYPGQNGALGYQVTGSRGGGGNATSPGAGGGGAAGDPTGVGAFGGAGANGVVYITWG